MDFSMVDRVCLQTLQAPDDADTWYTPINGTRTKLEDVIFRSPTTPIIGATLAFEGVGPMFSVHSDDVPDLAEGDLFERAGVKYIVVLPIDKDEGTLWVVHCRLF